MDGVSGGETRPSFRAAAKRVVGLRCPACGGDHLYRRYFVRAERCSRCGWIHERGEGHWVGGSEVHMLASYLFSVVLFGPLVVLSGFSMAGCAAAVAGNIAFSLLFYRYSRAIFLVADYCIDPDPARRGDDDGGPRVAAVSRPRSPAGMRRRVPSRKSARREPCEVVSTL